MHYHFFFMTERFTVDTGDKIDLQNRYGVVSLGMRNTSHKFASCFDRKIFGDISMFVDTHTQAIGSDEFYPFGKFHEDASHNELVGTGLGTLAHTLALAKILPLLQDPTQYSVRHFSATGGYKTSIERMGNVQSLTVEMSLAPYISNAIKACQGIGFDMEQIIKETQEYCSNIHIL